MLLNEKLKSKLKSKGKIAIVDLIVYALLIGIVFLIYFPIINNFCDMLKSKSDLIDISVAFIPKEPSLNRLFDAIQHMNYWTGFAKTGSLSLAVSLIQMIICTLTGYGLARYKFPLKNLVFALVIFTMIVPTQLLLQAYYLQFMEFDFFGIIKLFTGNSIDLINTPWPVLILSSLGIGYKNGLFIFLTRQFFINMPKELEESARIDGAGFIRIFCSIMLPSSVPILVTVFLFGVSWTWTDQILTPMFMPGQEYFGMSIPAMWTPLHYAGFHDVEKAAITTTAVLLVLFPLFIVYFALQRFFVQGIERSGLVG